MFVYKLNKILKIYIKNNLKKEKLDFFDNI
jgi:hypothetical protein